MNEETAKKIKTLSMTAHAELAKILYTTTDKNEIEELKLPVGTCLSYIYVDIFLRIYSDHPKLNHLS